MKTNLTCAGVQDEQSASETSQFSRQYFFNGDRLTIKFNINFKI